MMTQTRFSALKKANPEIAEHLFEKTKKDAEKRFFNYARLTGQEEKIRTGLEALKK
jgi:pyruvate-ferredoxin/flavodoxin oxidoreductase